MKVAIVDDDQIFMNQLKTNLTHSFDNIEIDTYRFFHDEIYTKDYQCLFLDVMLKEGESFVFGEMMLNVNPNITIVYISSIDHFVYQSYQQDTFFFIRKSNFDKDYENFVKKYKQLQLKENQTLTLTIHNMPIPLPQQDIVYIESMRNQIIVYTTSNSYIAYMTLKDTYQKLDQNQFYKLNSHIIVNLNYVIHVNKDHLLLTQNTSIPFTRGSKKSFMNTYVQYRRNHLWNG